MFVKIIDTLLILTVIIFGGGWLINKAINISKIRKQQKENTQNDKINS